jgi:hypothetical protein
MFLKGYKKFANNAGDALPGLVCLLLLSAAFFLLEFLEIAKTLLVCRDWELPYILGATAITISCTAATGIKLQLELEKIE